MRPEKMGVENADKVVGTHSAKFWASLGPEYRHEMKLEFVKYMMSQPEIVAVVEQIRDYHWIFLEEVCIHELALALPHPADWVVPDPMLWLLSAGRS